MKIINKKIYVAENGREFESREECIEYSKTKMDFNRLILILKNCIDWNDKEEFDEIRFKILFDKYFILKKRKPLSPDDEVE